jgi:RNA polymerase sigma factor (sigma-70 family)
MDTPNTPKTLLSILSKDASNQVLWTQLVHLYEPLIRFWLTLKGIPQDDLDDCTQHVLLRLVRVLKNTGYDANRARFRTLLGNIVFSVATDTFRKTQRDKNNLPTIPLDDLPDPYENVPEKIDAQFQYVALQTVFESIRAGRIELSPLHREVFDACIEGVESPSDFAKRNGLRPNTIIQIKRHLTDKIHKLANAY